MTDYEKTKPEFTVYFDEQAIRDHCEASGISLDGLTAEQIRQAGLMAADDFEGDPLVWTAFNNALQDALTEVRATERKTQPADGAIGLDHAACDPSAHDRSLPDDDQADVSEIAEDGLLGCIDCREPLYYCKNDNTYHHVDPTHPCWLHD